MKKIVSVLSVIFLLSQTVCVSAANGGAETQDTSESIGGISETAYHSYISAADTSAAVSNIEIPLTLDSVKTLSDGAELIDGSIVFSREEASAQLDVEVATSGCYRIELGYIPDVTSNFSYSSVGVKINGQYPFDEARELELSWRWKNADITTDTRGNEILGSMECIAEKTESLLCDPSGRQAEPLLFYFEKGSNSLEITAHTGNLKLTSVKLRAQDNISDYEEVLKNYDADETSGELKIIEAENFIEASDTTLSPDYDKSSAATSPNDPLLLLYNYIPGEKYSTSGQWLTWEFTPEKSGLYNISMRVRQNDKSGFSVVRKLYINGEIPFEECKELKFDYSGDWYIKTLGGDTPYSFYFEAGKTYTLKLEVSPGTISEVTTDIDDLIYSLNSLYRSVIMVVGNDPDVYRDYQLGKVITGFKETLTSQKEQLDSIIEKLEKRNSGKTGSSLSSFHSLANRLERFIKDPDLMAQSLSSFKSEVQSLSSWNQDAKEQPLDIDYIAIHSPDTKVKGNRVGFIGQMIFDLKRIVASFTDDYGVVGDVYDDDSSIDVWMTTGRDQMNIIKKLVDNSFSAQKGINVNISLVTVDIRTAVLAGTAPDLSLFISSDMPINLALRGAVADLSQFESFNDVSSRFGSHAMLPFEYNEGCYALPISETFNMMFVRTDIFEELGLSVPETWEEFYHVSTILQRNNLEVGIPSNIGMFATLLFQNGGEFYNSELTGTAFDSDAAIDAFKTWTGLFSRYGFPLTYDFYNRFSSGEMPLAITDYTQYLKVQAASPELSGRWEMCMIPGVKKADGTVDRTLSVSAATGSDTSPGLAQSITSAVIFSQSDKKEQAWTFLDWFTSDETQSKYGREIEDALGSISRYTSANVNAFKSLPWSVSERQLLETQRDCIKTLNEISGNYSVTREMINAFRKVVYDNANATDTIYTYNKRINKELSRKNG